MRNIKGKAQVAAGQDPIKIRGASKQSAKSAKSAPIEIDTSEDEGARPARSDDHETIENSSEDEISKATGSGPSRRRQNSAEKVVHRGHVARMSQSYGNKRGRVLEQPPMPGVNVSDDDLLLAQPKHNKVKSMKSKSSAVSAAGPSDSSTGRASSTQSKTGIYNTARRGEGGSERSTPLGLRSLPVSIIQYDWHRVQNPQMVVHWKGDAAASNVKFTSNRKEIANFEFSLEDIGTAQAVDPTKARPAMILVLRDGCRASKYFSTSGTCLPSNRAQC